MKKMKIENEKLKTKRFPLLTMLFSAMSLFSMFELSSCQQLQNSLSSEQELKQQEETGVATIDGDTWYYDGISTTDFSKTTGATLAVTFNRDVVVEADKSVADDGTVTYTSKLSGNLKLSYTMLTGQEITESIPISQGTFVLDDDDNPVSAGELSKDGKTFRLNMQGVVNLLDAQTIESNELKMEVQLSGFVCPSGNQKGRKVSALKKTVLVKPLYLDETITDGITVFTANKTLGTSIVIPTQGKVRLADGAKLEFSSPDSDASSLTSENFTLKTGADGQSLVITCDQELEQKTFTGSFKISGILPALNASSYTRTFAIVFSPMTSSTDSLDANGDSNASSTTGFSSDISSLSCYNDSENLYVLLKFSNPPSLYNGDSISVLISNPSSPRENILASKVAWGTDFRRGIGSKVALADGSSISAQITTFVQTGTGNTDVCSTVLDYGEGVEKNLTLTNTSGSEIVPEYKSSDWRVNFGVATLVYTVPLSDLNLTSGDNVYLYAAVTNYDGGNAAIADHIPTKAMTNSDGSSVSSAWASKNGSESYLLDMSKGLKHIITED